MNFDGKKVNEIGEKTHATKKMGWNDFGILITDTMYN